MKKTVHPALLPGWAIVILLNLMIFSSLTAQTDVSQRIKSLPKKDGTYLLAVVDSVYFYAVKRQGKITGYEATDANGVPVPESDPSQGQMAAKMSGAAGGGTGSGFTDPKPTICVSGPEEICRWSNFSKSCVCISTVLK